MTDGVSLTGCLAHPIAKHLKPVARELLVAWSRLAMREFVPDRQSFDPMSIARILPVVSLIERTSDDEWHLRLIGTEIERRWGRSLTGCNYLELLSPQAASKTLREFRAIVEHPCGSWSLRRLQLSSGELTTVETLRLPLRASDGFGNMILSCSGEISRAFHSTAHERRRIVTVADQQFFDIGAGVPG
jgi:hypothetical protein